MSLSRRDFLKSASAGIGAAHLAAGHSPRLLGSDLAKASGETSPHAYKHRIAFGCWVNDMRNDPLPLEGWPAPQLDDETVSSIVQALDLQSRWGYNMLDAAGYDSLAKGWNPQITGSLDKDRIARVKQILKAGHDRGMKMQYVFGTYSWGFDAIIAAHPDLAALTAPGGVKSKVALCDANPQSFQWVGRILDYVLSEFDFDAVHLESADLGYCHCPQCAGRDGSTAYNCRIVAKTAEYIRGRWPDKLLTAMTIGWIPFTQKFTVEDQGHIRELTRHIDCLFDQGHLGTLIDKRDQEAFIRSIHCDYGTSGAVWLYPSVRWDREAYFVPYTQMQGHAIRDQFRQGVRGCMHYQGPVANPATEVNIACGGRILSDTSRSPEDVLSEVVEALYKPKTAAAHASLVDIYQRGERAYFDGWSEERLRKAYGTDPPGEFFLGYHAKLPDDAPQAAGYMIYDHFLDAQGRQAYKQGLISIVRDLEKIRHSFHDHGRVERLRRSLILSLTLLNTVIASKGEAG